jgi:uncharacterized protein YqgC (DUF456 family)
MSGAEVTGFVLAGIVMVLGLIGTLLPGIPGAPLILAAAVGHKLYFGADSISYFGLFVLVVLTILSMVLDFFGSLLGAKKLGATWRGMAGAIVGAIVGLFFNLPGLILGPIIGAFLFELLSGREWRESAKAGAGALLGMLLGMVGRVVCCVIMIAVFSLSVLWNHDSGSTTVARIAARSPGTSSVSAEI